MSKYTPWFDPVTQPPVRLGWYPVKGPSFPSGSRKHWNGNNWSCIAHSSSSDCQCAASETIRGVQTGFRWRGLAAPHPEWKGKT